jgi:hypothetical protein
MKDIGTEEIIVKVEECNKHKKSLKDNFYAMEIPLDWAKKWLLTRHYLKRTGPSSFIFGLFRKEGNELVGIATFGVPPNKNLCTGLCGPEFSGYVLEFNRLCLEDDLPKNSESFFASKCFNLLEKQRGATILVSYADWEQGHIGYIYQALGWIYTGLIKKDILEIDGKEVHQRTVVCKRTGTTSVSQLKEKLGDRLTIKEAKGKHRYVYFLGNRGMKKKFRKALRYQVLPYPKGDVLHYDIGKGWEKEGLFLKV